MMQQIRIINVGSTKNSYLCEGEKDFFNRLKHYARMSIQYVKEEKIRNEKQSAQVLDAEGDRILKILQPSDYVILLDSRGKNPSSEELASKIGQWQNRGVNPLTFVIGGPLGVNDALRKRANEILSLSRMTFTHEMIRTLFYEQLYRAFTILNNEKYHK